MIVVVAFLAFVAGACWMYWTHEQQLSQEADEDLRRALAWRAYFAEIDARADAEKAEQLMADCGYQREIE